MRDQDDIHLSVIIPAYNEEDRLPRTLREVESYLGRQDYPSEVIVVDDGSVDQTVKLVGQHAASSARTRLVVHLDRTNRGKGASVRLGMAQARGRYRLFMDADNSTSLDQIEGFWGWFEQEYEIVIGSRQAPGARIAVHQPWYKELAGRGGNLLIRALAVPGIRDTQAGFKLFSRRSAEIIFPRLTINRWGFDFEALAIARVHGFRVREVPIHWVNSPATRVRLSSYFQVLSEVWHVRRNLRRGLYR
jgi:dolichyl-phosphate beta-glucosyltransferase